MNGEERKVMETKVLIIDDDEKLITLLENYLAGFGFNLLSATHPQEGLKRIQNDQPQMVILDVMLPDMDGFEVCRQIRKESSIPILMLTARGDVMDRIVGLEIGADDYLAKPFEPRELIARIQSILRRAVPAPVGDSFECNGLTINFAKHTVYQDEKALELTTTEFAALSLLVKNPGKVLSRDDILEELRGIECDAFNRTVDITMSRIRNKLNDNPKNPKYIKTVWGAGYVFIGGEENETAISRS